ncbi:MAG: type II secretion system F family protein, partial [Phycisphaerae bacterium]
MPRFAYKAVTGVGEDVAGELEAPDRPAALRELVQRGVHVLEIGEKSPRRGLFGERLLEGARATRLRPRQLAGITRQLATALEAGLPLLTALDVMCRELDHAPSRELLRHVAVRVQQGASLSDALEDYPRVFEPMYVRLVRVGETGGMLDAVLGQLADLLERRIELRERVKTASIYPAIVLLLGLASVVVIVAFIVPRIMESIGVEGFLLPWPTRVLLAASGAVQRHWPGLLIALIAAAAAWRQGVLYGPGRDWWDRTKLGVPILGRLIRQLEAARFARSLGMLARGGVTLTEALPVVGETLQNATLREAVRQVT